LKYHIILNDIDRMPAMAAPTAAPVTAFSETGVSITLSGPNRSRSPPGSIADIPGTFNPPDQLKKQIRPPPLSDEMPR